MLEKYFKFITNFRPSLDRLITPTGPKDLLYDQIVRLLPKEQTKNLERNLTKWLSEDDHKLDGYPYRLNMRALRAVVKRAHLPDIHIAENTEKPGLFHLRYIDRDGKTILRTYQNGNIVSEEVTLPGQENPTVRYEFEQTDPHTRSPLKKITAHVFKDQKKITWEKLGANRVDKDDEWRKKPQILVKQYELAKPSDKFGESEIPGMTIGINETGVNELSPAKIYRIDFNELKLEVQNDPNLGYVNES